MNKKKTLLTAVFAAVGFFWRPWLGGSFGDISRIWKLIILAGITILMYYTAGHFPVTGKEWAFFAWVYLWFMRFWNHTIGDYFYVNDTRQDEGRSKWVDTCLRLIYGPGGYYNFKGNITGLFLGYTVPAVLAAVAMPNFNFVAGGAVVALTYGLTGRLLSCPEYKRVKIAEYISGALCFALFYSGLF